MQEQHQYMSLTEGRKRIFEIADKLQHDIESCTFTEHGKPKAVLISNNTYQSWKQTIDLITNHPKEVGEIVHQNNQRIKSYLELENILASEGYLVADKAKKLYDANPPESKS